MLPGPQHHPASNQTSETLLPWQPLRITKEMSHSILPVLDSHWSPHINSKSTTGCGPAQWEKKDAEQVWHTGAWLLKESPGIIPHYPLGKIKRTQTTAARLEALDRTQGTFAWHCQMKQDFFHLSRHPLVFRSEAPTPLYPRKSGASKKSAVVKKRSRAAVQRLTIQWPWANNHI